METEVCFDTQVITADVSIIPELHSDQGVEDIEALSAFTVSDLY